MHDATPADRFRMAMQLYELAEAMLRQRLRRKNPHATEAEIEARVVAWRSERPGAEYGDAAGTGRLLDGGPLRRG